MKNNFNFVVRLSTFFVMFYCMTIISTSSVFAQNVQKIAILDLGLILYNSLAMKDIDLQLKAEDKKLKLSVKSREAEFRLEKQKLDQQRAILQPELFKEKVKALNETGLGYRNEFNSKLKQLAKSRTVAIRKIEKALEPIVSEVASSVGATMIVEKKKILFGAKNLNISDMVSDRLNKKLTKLKLELVPLKN